MNVSVAGAIMLGAVEIVVTGLAGSLPDSTKFNDLLSAENVSIVDLAKEDCVAKARACSEHLHGTDDRLKLLRLTLQHVETGRADDWDTFGCCLNLPRGADGAIVYLGREWQAVWVFGRSDKQDHCGGRCLPAVTNSQHRKLLGLSVDPAFDIHLATIHLEIRDGNVGSQLPLFGIACDGSLFAAEISSSAAGDRSGQCKSRGQIFKPMLLIAYAVLAGPIGLWLMIHTARTHGFRVWLLGALLFSSSFVASFAAGTMSVAHLSGSPSQSAKQVRRDIKSTDQNFELRYPNKFMRVAESRQADFVWVA